MNRWRRSEKWLSLALLIAMVWHFAFDHREASAFVLCFGADGHVAVERSGHDHRPLTPSGLDNPVASETPLSIAAVPCVDVPIVSDDHGSHAPFPESGTGWSAEGWVAVIAFYFLLLPFVRTAFAAFRIHSPPLLDARLLLRRSVVLLI